MKLFISILLSFFSLLSFAQNTKKEFYSIKINDLNEKPLNLSQYKGKKILIVNVASECGYTYQYKDLQKLYEQNKDHLVVLGVPSNDFGKQEPGSHKEIGSFCEAKYAITFPMTEKIKVKGQEKHELYQWLSGKSLNGWNTQEPKWNFYKYLINEKGQLIQVFTSSTEPLSEEIETFLKK